MSFRRPRILRKYRNGFRLLLVIIFVYTVVDGLFLLSSLRPSHHFRPIPRVANLEQIFIASIHWNNADILRSHWNQALLELVQFLGPKSVFVSLLENGSWDDSKHALRELDDQLAKFGVPRRIVLEDISREAEITRTPSVNESGWIWTPRSRRELRRIPHLAELRNRVMLELGRASDSEGKHFDKVLWLNDVVFTTEDIVTLLSTRDGNYSAACALDFARPPLYYDTFALRDSAGAKTALQTWPFFSSTSSRNALISNLPVPVQSCWNGVMAMDAQPFYGSKPLHFRGLHDKLASKHLEASECCLIHADNPLSITKGIWLNPNVKVGYSAKAYNAVNTNAIWPTTMQRFKGLWMVRLALIPIYWQRTMENWVVRSKLRQWEDEHPDESRLNNEPGAHCIVNEMQVLVENGWKHL